MPALKILEKLTTKVFGNSYIFLGPFRFIMRHRDLLRGYMEELEKIHDNKDVDSADDKEKSLTVNTNLAEEVSEFLAKLALRIIPCQQSPWPPKC